MLELIVGFETNMSINAERKKEKYKHMMLDLEQRYSKVSFINLSVSDLGVFSKQCTTFISMLKYMNFNDKEIQFTIQKVMNI